MHRRSDRTTVEPICQISRMYDQRLADRATSIVSALPKPTGRPWDRWWKTRVSAIHHINCPHNHGDYHLPTLLSRVFAPAEECQDPACRDNRAHCQQRRVAVLRVERQ